MGKVNEYISKIIDKINSFKYNEEKPWLKYYDRMPEHLNYYNGSMYDMVNDVFTIDKVKFQKTVKIIKFIKIEMIRIRKKNKYRKKRKRRRRNTAVHPWCHTILKAGRQVH